MPLGDSSLTEKSISNYEIWGATELSYGNRLGLMATVDFVGSTSTGPDSLGDKDHEGHPGKTIDGLTLASGVAEHHTPDIVTLIIGTR